MFYIKRPTGYSWKLQLPAAKHAYTYLHIESRRCLQRFGTCSCTANPLFSLVHALDSLFF